MKLRIEHTTTFTYEEAISEAYTEMRLRPLDGSGQRCLRFKLSTEPVGDVMQYTDRYGNVVHHFDALQSHDRVVVTATSDVHLSQTFADYQRELSPLEKFDYLGHNEYTTADERIRSFATNAVQDDATATVLALMHALRESLQYESGITNVKTTAAEALDLGRGVCQDFAHIMLAGLRSIGIPARYVSGYLYNPQAPTSASAEMDNAASHAWVDAFVNNSAWLSVDPTHDCLQTTNYVRVAVGRDYSDVPPTRGVYKGQSKETLGVNVLVTHCSTRLGRRV
jgi:transglutaminase-like putative cysteine protease